MSVSTGPSFYCESGPSFDQTGCAVLLTESRTAGIDSFLIPQGWVVLPLGVQLVEHDPVNADRFAFCNSVRPGFLQCFKDMVGVRSALDILDERDVRPIREYEREIVIGRGEMSYTQFTAPSMTIMFFIVRPSARRQRGRSYRCGVAAPPGEQQRASRPLR